MAVCKFYGTLKSSTDDFVYKLFCRPCKSLFLEKTVVPYLKHLVGLLSGSENKVTEAALFHFVFYAVHASADSGKSMAAS